uniref:hypothetical protein n=1 Tax=Streptomyces sp. PU-14G TaxID=2800808 RepID=UPI0034DE2A78
PLWRLRRGAPHVAPPTAPPVAPRRRSALRCGGVGWAGSKGDGDDAEAHAGTAETPRRSLHSGD